jgi:pyridoxamine-phosphate oxidase
MTDIRDDAPLELFQSWLAEATESEPNDPTAMTVATADADGMPSARMVLLKDADERGFVFYTNTESQKGCELDENPRAALVFHWKTLRRQVRVSGAVERTSDAEADAYFATRQPDWRLGVRAVTIAGWKVRAGKTGGEIRRQVRCRQRPTAAALDRLQGRPGPIRVLAGQTVPFA